MTGTDVLRAEHKAILRMLQVINICAKEIQNGNLAEIETVYRAVDFFKNFTDRCHHRKEEELLFPLLVEKGIPNEGGPVGVMLSEHVQGRNFVKGIFESTEKIKNGDNVAVASLVSNILGYVSLLERHIEKENDVLFKMAERILTEDEQTDLYEKFELLEKQEIGEGVHEQYHQMIHELEEIYGVK